MVPFRQTLAVLEYQGYFVVIGYFGPSSLHDTYSEAFQMVGQAARRNAAS